MIAAALALLALVFMALLLLYVPIAFAVGVAAVIGMLAAGDGDVVTSIAQRMAAGVDSFPLLAIPLFILAGNIMGTGGLARRLINAAKLIVGRLPGGMSIASVVSCMLFGSISGSAAAAISSIGAIMIPALENEGEDRAHATALVTTAATTGLLIPPSNVMIVYAVVAQTSVAALFFAGIGPGVLLGLFIIVAAIITRRSKHTPATTSTRTKANTRTSHPLLDIALAMPSLVIVIVVLGGILGGAFSATEAAGVSVFLACLAAIGERIMQGVLREDGQRMRLRDIPALLRTSARTTSIVLFLIAASQALSWVLAYLRVPQEFAEHMLAITSNPIALLLLMNIALLLVGTVLDMTPAVLIFTPIFLPVAQELGLHPAHFGVVMILNLCIGLCTPPVGGCLFVGCTIGNVSITRLTRPMLPFYAAMIAALVVTTAAAPLSMALPNALGLIHEDPTAAQSATTRPTATPPTEPAP